jgi:hypothetical protein
VLAAAVPLLWDHSRLAQPTRPRIALARVSGGPTFGAPDPALTTVLWRLTVALRQRDLPALHALTHPDGLAVAPYGGGLPDAGREVPAREPLLRDLLAGADVVILGWRTYGADGVIAVADGWGRRPLRLTGPGTTVMTSLGAVGLLPVDGTWRVRWLMVDGVDALARDLNRDLWLPPPT